VLAVPPAGGVNPLVVVAGSVDEVVVPRGRVAGGAVVAGAVVVVDPDVTVVDGSVVAEVGGGAVVTVGGGGWVDEGGGAVEDVVGRICAPAGAANVDAARISPTAAAHARVTGPARRTGARPPPGRAG
jgi:hypothetical protein